jgi:hypothetical protein
MPNRVEELKTLKNADEALYQLWRKLPVLGPFVLALNTLQNNFIRPRIEQLEEENKDAKASSQAAGG